MLTRARVRAFHSSLALLLVSSTLTAAEAPNLKQRRLPDNWNAAQGQPVTVSAAPIADRTLALQRLLGVAPAAEMSRERVTALAAIRKQTIYRASSGTPRQMPLGAVKLDVNTARAADPEVAAARSALRFVQPLLAIADPDNELQVMSVDRDALGARHIRFQQYYGGVPVWRSRLIVHLDAAGNPSLLDGSFVATPRRVSTRPVFTGESAATIAASASKIAKARTSSPRLVLYPTERGTRLGWSVKVDGAHHESREVIVDAANGNVLASFDLVHAGNVAGSGVDLMGVRRNLNVWQDGSTFYLIDSSKNMYDATSTPPSPDRMRGVVFITDARNAATDEPDLYHVTSNNASSWEANGVSASWAFSQTYDYFLERHSRKSFDNKGATMTAIIRYQQNFANAFWNSGAQMMVFGTADRYAASLDVVAHEMSHAVTTNTADLVYEGQSGALNEAMSDVFGEMTELRTFGSNDWIIGSQLVDKIRDMAAPERFGDPSKMSAFVVTTQDHGGVHTNSGIINKSFYNLVKLIGAADAEKIFYRALSAHLVARSDFIDARLAAVQSAKEIFGANSNQATKTAEAFDAVEIFEQAPPPPEPEIPAVSGNDSTLFVYEQGGSKFIGRRETALNDPAIGVQLGSLTAAATRPSVSGDGTVAFYVTSARDACFLRTDGTQAESCIGASGRIASVAMSPDGKQYAFVLLDSAGQLTNTIRVINIATGSDRTYTLPAAVTEGASAGFVEFADTMEFTSTGDFLVYDAYTVTEYAGGYNAGAWSIYAIDLATAEVYPLFGPILGADIEYPAFSSRSDRYLAFDVQTSNTSYVFLSDLETASSNYVYSESGFIGIPSYSGDDSAFTYSFATNTPSGYSIARWNLANDRTTPSGQPSLWMDDANFGVIYRRGTYSGPTTQPGKMEFASATHVATEGSVLSVMVFRVSGSKGAASVHYRTTPGTATTPNDYFTTTGTLTWADGDEDPKFIKINIAADQLTENNETFTVSLDSPVGGTIGSRPTSTITIKNMAPPPQGRKRPVGRR